jgi:hypothetical protein
MKNHIGQGCSVTIDSAAGDLLRCTDRRARVEILQGNARH